MLENLLGVRLLLLLGDTVPLPASHELMSALKQVEVTSDTGQGDGFQITFSLARSGLLDYGLIQNGAVNPMKRIIIAVMLGVQFEVLIDGVVTHHQYNPGNQPGQATLTVTGRDLSVLMDLEEKNESYPNQPDFLIATRVLAGYAKYGIVPQAMPTVDVPIMLQRIPRQQESDLQFLQRLAGRNGYVFYLEPLTLGVSQAYFGPENRLGVPQPALSVNLGPSTNVRSISFTNDALNPISVRGQFIDPVSKASIPIPVLPSLKVPLAAMPAAAHRTELLRTTANQAPATAATTALARVTNAADPLTAEGEVDAVQYGHVLRARALVGVRGAGLTYNGTWYVRRVTHKIVPRVQYSQHFQLSREGTLALTPAVRP